MNIQYIAVTLLLLPPKLLSCTDEELHQAVTSNHISLCKKLIKSGANVNARNNNQQTPLHIVAKQGNQEIASLLLAQNDTNINAKDSNEDTALHIAMKAGKRNICFLLILYKANLNAKDRYHSTPLHIVALDKDQKEIAYLLILHGARVNEKDQWGYTPLHNAAEQGCQEICKLLMKYGAHIFPTREEKQLWT